MVLVLEGWGILTGSRNGFTMFKGKHKVLCLRYSNSCATVQVWCWNGWMKGGWAEHESAVYPHMKNANHILGCISSSIARQVKGMIGPSIWHLQDCILSTVSSYGPPKSRKIHSGASPAEGHQDCQVLEHVAYRERLREVSLFSSKKRQLKGMILQSTTAFWEYREKTEPDLETYSKKTKGKG